jgi:Pilus assembly protein, PilO.
MTIESISLLFHRVHFVRWALGAILLNALAFAFWIVPNQAKVATLESNYANFRREAVDEQRHLHDLQARIGRLEQAKKDLQYLYANVLVPRKAGVMDIRLEVEDMVQQSGLKRTDFSYGYGDLPEFHLKQFRLAVPIEGSYRDIRKFINNIERSKHFLILDRVELFSIRADVLSLNFSISTYLVEDEI